MHTGFQHVDGVRAVVKGIQITRGLSAFREHVVGHDLAQVVQIGLDAIHACTGQCLLHLFQRGLAIHRLDDDLGDHRIVVGRDVAAALHPGLVARIPGKFDASEHAAGRLEILVRIFRIQARPVSRHPWV